LFKKGSVKVLFTLKVFFLFFYKKQDPGHLKKNIVIKKMLILLMEKKGKTFFVMPIIFKIKIH
jgi:hypothetical protein